MAEQRYQAVLAVISDGLSVSQVAQKFRVSRQTLHSWLARRLSNGRMAAGDKTTDAVVWGLVEALACAHALLGGHRFVTGCTGNGIRLAAVA